MKSSCPPVTVNVDAIVETVKDQLLSRPAVEADVHAARVHGLGMVKGLVPRASDFDGTNFVLGYSLIPPVINFASKLADEGVILPKIDKTLFRGVATGLNLIVQLFTGKSFLLGSLIGQIPTTMDSLADIAVGAVKSAKGLKGLGATPEEELKKLRQDLERLSGYGMGEEAEDELEGVRGREVVFG